jgi:outer membrane protein OmpA-like peptidoglycan-associated protein
VGDAFDVAPNAPENINFFEDTDGQPEVLPVLMQKVLGPQPRYRFNRTSLTDAGLERAELLAGALTEYPDVRVRITVADLDGDRAQRRAMAIAAAVVAAGVVADRVEPVGVEGEAAVTVELIP